MLLLTTLFTVFARLKASPHPPKHRLSAPSDPKHVWLHCSLSSPKVFGIFHFQLLFFPCDVDMFLRKFPFLWGKRRWVGCSKYDSDIIEKRAVTDRHTNMHRHVVRLDCVKETKMKSSFNIIIVIIAWLFKACLLNGVTVMLNWLLIMCCGVKVLCGINAHCHEDSFTNAYDYYNCSPKKTSSSMIFIWMKGKPCTIYLIWISSKAKQLNCQMLFGFLAIHHAHISETKGNEQTWS